MTPDARQLDGIQRVFTLVARGTRRIVLVAPTGFGKTLMMAEMLRQVATGNLYTHRRMLLDQTSARLTEYGVDHGIRAAGYEEDLGLPVQLCSIQTEASRVFKNHKRGLHYAELSLVDECHAQKGETIDRIAREQVAGGGAVVGCTATCTDLAGLYDDVVTVCGVRDAIDLGRLVPAHHYAPDEPDYKKLKQQSHGEFERKSVVSAMMTKTIFGRVLEHWRKLNPEGKPTLLFAPGVSQSLWFAEQFHEAHVPVAHIDGKALWHDGHWYDSTSDNRHILSRLVESGEVQVVCNRFVMREGIDWPFLYCGILATAFGSLSSYLQSAGRLLRAHPGKDHALIIDHGGNWHRHGSVNENRDWFLDRSECQASCERIERYRSKKEPEPICCQRCGMVRRAGAVCPGCGHKCVKSVRQVVQLDGTLKPVEGKIYRARRRSTDGRLISDWIGCVKRCEKTNRTFRQAEALFAYEHNWVWPSRDWPFAPTLDADWYRRVKDVPRERLK